MRKNYKRKYKHLLEEYVRLQVMYDVVQDEVYRLRTQIDTLEDSLRKQEKKEN